MKIDVDSRIAIFLWKASIEQSHDKLLSKGNRGAFLPYLYNRKIEPLFS